MRILIYSSCELSSELMMTRRLFVGLGELLVPTFIVRTVKESHYDNDCCWERFHWEYYCSQCAAPHSKIVTVIVP